MQGSTTTNLSETYVAGKGVVSATIDNVTKTINVKLARDDNQASLDARMTVTAVDNAKITNVNGTPVPNDGATTTEIDADDKSYIEVTSQTGGNVSKFTVVATYEDALATMEIQGLTASGTPAPLLTPTRRTTSPMRSSSTCLTWLWKIPRIPARRLLIPS